MKIRAAAAADWDQMSWLLTAAQLPVEDLQPDELAGFLVAFRAIGDREEIVGLIGLQRFAEIGLLRSLVVAESMRGSGLGTRLLRALESAAAAFGIRELWLLTNDAQAYFERLAYEIRLREDAPAPIRETRQFGALCPATATLMSRELLSESVHYPG